MIMFGEPGQGKSARVKIFCLGLMPYGYRTLILGDVKDEYEPLCRAVGVSPHAVGHGLPARINPLDFGPLGGDWTQPGRAEAQRRAAMRVRPLADAARGLVGSQQVAFDPTAETAVGAALAEITGYTTGADRMAEITIPQLWHALAEPSPSWSPSAATPSRQHFLDDTRPSVTRSARWSAGTSPACSTPPPPSPWTGAPRSSPCRCPGWTGSATRPSGSR